MHAYSHVSSDALCWQCFCCTDVVMWYVGTIVTSRWPRLEPADAYTSALPVVPPSGFEACRVVCNQCNPRLDDHEKHVPMSSRVHGAMHV